jgi:hypothetical protein
VECWGGNVDGELGSAAPGSYTTTPVPVALPAPAVGIWGDQATHPCALLKDGSVWCWGVRGVGTVAPPPVPPPPPVPQTGFAAPVQSLTTGGEFGMSCALLTTGAVQCWGQATLCLGDGNPSCLGEPGGDYSAQPVDVLPSGSGAIEIRSSDEDACALLASGAVLCWGQTATPTLVPGL